MMDEISVCIPAYRAEAFIGETLESVNAQTYPDLKVLVSIDSGDDDNTAEICRQYDHNGSMRIWSQPENLGWAGNVNFLLEQVDTPYFFLLLHDDLLAPTYATTLMEALQGAPDCIFAYTGIRNFGTMESASQARDLRGSVEDRMLSFLLYGLGGLPLRALVRSSALSKGHRLRTNAYDSFATEAVWALDLLRHGGGCAVPGALYLKRRREDSLIPGRASWPMEKRLHALLEHAAQCRHSIVEAVDDPGALSVLLAAVLAYVRISLERMKYVNAETAPEIAEFLLPAVVGAAPAPGLETEAAVNGFLAKDDALQKIAARSRFADGLRFLHKDRPLPASEIFAEALTFDPNLSPARERLITCLLRLNRFEEALTAAEQGIERFPNLKLYRILAARAALPAGRFDEARAHARACLDDSIWAKRGKELLENIDRMEAEAADGEQAETTCSPRFVGKGKPREPS